MTARTLPAVVLAMLIAGALGWAQPSIDPPSVRAAQRGCGLAPIKPIPPIGCKDLVAECRCDRGGRNCRWEWVCIPG